MKPYKNNAKRSKKCYNARTDPKDDPKDQRNASQNRMDMEKSSFAPFLSSFEPFVSSFVQAPTA